MIPTATDECVLFFGGKSYEAPWIKAYAASEMATGELSEKASRAVWADIAITRAASLAEALDAIFAALSVSSRR